MRTRSQNERVLATVGTTQGSPVEVCCAPHHIALRKAGKLYDEFLIVNATQARELGEAIVSAAERIGG